MPQVTMQYSSGLQLDVPATLLAINQALLASGQFQAEDIKSRAILLQDWLTGTKLEDFQLGEESTTVVAGPSRLWPVVLKVRDARGKTVARKVAYQVTGSPQISVVRQD